MFFAFTLLCFHIEMPMFLLISVRVWPPTSGVLTANDAARGDRLRQWRNVHCWASVHGALHLLARAHALLARFLPRFYSCSVTTLKRHTFGDIISIMAETFNLTVMPLNWLRIVLARCAAHTLRCALNAYLNCHTQHHRCATISARLLLRRIYARYVPTPAGSCL